MPAPEYILRMDPNNVATLVDILKSHEARCKALAGLTLVTDAEKVVFVGEAAVCQYAYLQLEGVYYQNPPGAPDWSAAETSGRLPSEVLATVVDQEAAQTDVQPTPAPEAVAQPFRLSRHPQCRVGMCANPADYGNCLFNA